MIYEHIAILGAGSMGTGLAKMLGEGGRAVMIWAYEPEVAEEINSTRQNSVFLPGFELPSSVTATNSFSEALGGADLVLSATPAQVLRSVWQEASPSLESNAAVVSTSKGIEIGSACLMSDVLADVIPSSEHRLGYLSGPSFAKEFAALHPTAVVVASSSQNLATRVQETLSSPTFRIYTTDDVVGVELGGALKNVIALAVGAAEGMGLGHNSRAALITRGLAEISRLAVTCGANPLTLAGLAGMGDLVLTCTGQLSRNLQVGNRLGRGETIDEILESMNMVAEGVQTARSTLELARKKGVEMPICQAVVSLLDGGMTPTEAVQGLMTRKLRSEREY